MDKFGFGCMRLPMAGGEVDRAEMNRMVDAFMENGFNYFDTAHGYLNGKSETALRDCLTSRYPREKYILANKLSGHFITKNEDIRPLFRQQLEACGVEYFDYYLMHAQDRNSFERYKDLGCYETSLELLDEGRIRHFGISFHDQAFVLERILKEYPRIEVVQIQLNYVDFDDPSVESRKCLEVCRKYGKPAIVMEPVKGGSLVNLPEEARKAVDDMGGVSAAGLALRFAAAQEGVMMVLSGMGSMAMMEDNISAMRGFEKLSAQEKMTIEKVKGILNGLGTVSCTACRYCTEVCPQEIAIPEIFACVNARKLFRNWNTDYYYNNIHTKGKGPADCVKCGLCENICPQHLKIRDLIQDAAKEFAQ